MALENKEARRENITRSKAEFVLYGISNPFLEFVKKAKALF